MTCREKYREMFPSEEDVDIHAHCPYMLNIMNPPDDCATITCDTCWDREIPEEKIDGKTIYAHIGPFKESGITTLNIESNWVIDESEESVETSEWPKENPNLLKKNSNDAAPHILDSGNRTQFESGAVRDCQAGKGRCDLLPLDIVGECMQSGPILQEISAFCKTGDVDHLYKALWEFSGYWSETDTGSTMMLEVSKHFEEGAVKYGEDNWRKGIPAKRYIDSAVRHYLKFLRGDKDERHDRAFCWNLLCCAWTCTHKPELNDYTKTSEVIRG